MSYRYLPEAQRSVAMRLNASNRETHKYEVTDFLRFRLSVASRKIGEPEDNGKNTNDMYEINVVPSEGRV